jgi:hypothetical protein
MSNGTQETLQFWIDVQIKEDSIRLAHRRIVWRIKAKRAFYYHGTQESRLQSIIKEGLKPSCMTGHENYEISVKDAVYLTEDPKEAEMWANWNRKDIVTQKETHREKAFVICVPKSRVDQNRLEKDRNLPMCVSFEYYGTIEPPFSFYEISES